MKIRYEDLILYAGDELDPIDRRRVEDAVRADPALKRELDMLQMQDKILRDMPLMEPRRDLVLPALERARRRHVVLPAIFRFVPFMARAASIMLLAGAVWFIWLRPQRGMEVARNAPAELTCVPNDVEVNERIGLMRAAIARLRAPQARAPALHEADGPDTRPLQKRMTGLRDVCRASAVPQRAPAARALDSRMNGIRSRMDEIREGLGRMNPSFQVELWIKGKGCRI